MPRQGVRHFHGIALLVAVLREASPLWRQKWLSSLRQAAPSLVRLFDEYEFVFADMVRLDDRGIQLCWRVIPERDLLIAWKLAKPELRERMLANLSARRRESFLAAFAQMPKMPKGQVLQVQRQIARTVRAFLSEGKAGLCSKRVSWKTSLTARQKTPPTPPARK